MDWLQPNWTYRVVFVGVILFMRFGGVGSGLGGRRAHPEHRQEQWRTSNEKE